MRRATWTKPKSSLPSDRLKPTIKPPTTFPKQKGKQSPPEPPKSKPVRILESLLGELKKSACVERDPKGGCFCLARVHGLSPYAPLCHSCGLILCEVNAPHYCCPHCNKTLLTPSGRETLITQLDSELASTIAEELKAAERAAEELRNAQGSFPTLSGSLPPSGLASTLPPRQTHKVLSLTQKKGVLVSSYTRTPAASRPVSRDEVVVEPERIPPPPSEPLHSLTPPSAERPFENMIKGGVTYVEKAQCVAPESSNEPNPSRRKRRNKGKGEDDPQKSDDPTAAEGS